MNQMVYLNIILKTIRRSFLASDKNVLYHYCIIVIIIRKFVVKVDLSSFYV